MKHWSCSLCVLAYSVTNAVVSTILTAGVEAIAYLSPTVLNLKPACKLFFFSYFQPILCLYFFFFVFFRGQYYVCIFFLLFVRYTC